MRRLLISLAIASFLGCALEEEAAQGPMAPWDWEPEYGAPPEGYVLAEPGPTPPVCIGPIFDDSIWSAEPGPVAVTEEAESEDVPPAPMEPDLEPPEEPTPCELSPGTCIGAPPPVWALRDFQPQSCGDGGVYGIEAFRGEATVVVLLAAW
jgi:hypothetical protein